MFVNKQGLQSLAAAASLAQLHHLDLSHNELGPSAADGLQQLVSRAAQLRALKLKNTALGGAGVWVPRL
jgi:Ran GTPase-activating protein (RanGAP) involved in mRNA processing and transport